MTAGEPFDARMRSASRSDDLPVLLRPVIKLTRPSPLTVNLPRARKFSTDSVTILDFTEFARDSMTIGLSLLSLNTTTIYRRTQGRPHFPPFSRVGRTEAVTQKDRHLSARRS